MARNIRRSGEPHDRLSEVAAAMLEGVEEEHGDLRMIVLLDDMEAGRGTAAMHGYENDYEAMVRILEHAEAIAKANGINFAVGTVPTMGQG